MDRVTQAQTALAAAEIEVAGAQKRLSAARHELHLATMERHEQRKRDRLNEVRRCREKAKNLAKRIGVEIELHDDLSDDSWFVSHPSLQDTPQDPYEGDHYVHDWPSILQRVEGYEAALKEAT